MTIAKPQTSNLIDTISAGYAALNKRLWVVLIPIALNIVLAFGAQISLAPLMQQARTTLDTIVSLAERDDQASAQRVDVRGQLNAMESQLRAADPRQMLLWMNFVPLLAIGVEAQLDAINPATLVINNAVQLMGAIIVLNAIGLIVSGIFLQQVATAVRIASGSSVATTLPTTMSQIGKVIGRVTLWALLVIASTLAVGVPFMLITAIVTLLLPQALYAFILLGWVAVFWVRIYIGFAVEAIAVDSMGPLRALYSSASVVRRNFFSTVGLLLISALITLGLGLVWQQLSVNTIGLILACAASAYIGSGLEAARMLFYRERLRSLKKNI